MGRWLFLGFVCVATPVSAAKVTGVAIVPGTVTIATDGPVAVAHDLALGSPDRLVVDVPAVAMAPLTANGASSVTRLRVANFAPGIVRLVIDLAAPVEIVRARAISAGGASSLVLTLRRVPQATFGARVLKGRRPLRVESGEGPPPAPTRPSDSFELPTTMFGEPRRRPAPVRPPTLPGASADGTGAAGVSRPSTSLGMSGGVGRPAGEAAPAPVAAPTPPASAAIAAPPVAAPTGLAVPIAAPPIPPEPPLPEPLPPFTPKTRAPGVRARSGGKPLVVIDAGHGGKDVGAISVNGRYEKEVTLAIARETARRLEASGKVRVKLTRDDDRFIPLGGRVTIARKARADLFISIHADAALNAQARGASVYTLSAVASDAVAARLAARENKADIIGGVNLGVEAPEVGDIMIDLSRRATTNVSVAFAELLQDELESRIPFRGEFHHFAGFYVLKAPDVPSVLLETGYVTNAEDSDLLFSGEGRRAVAQGIARAIERHLLGDR